MHSHGHGSSHAESKGCWERQVLSGKYLTENRLFPHIREVAVGAPEVLQVTLGSAHNCWRGWGIKL